MRAAHAARRLRGKGFAVPSSGGSSGGTDDFAATIPGWGARIFFEDFDTDVAEGPTSTPDSAFLSHPAYSSKWDAYDKFGYVTNQNPASPFFGNGNHYGGGLSVSNSELVMRHFRGSDGRWWATAPLPIIAGFGQQYGRYAVRWRVKTANSLVKTAFLTWPEDNNWPFNGEIDWPEGTITSEMHAFMHRQGASSGSDQDFYDSNVNYGVNVWHTTILEWKLNHCRFIVDGVASSIITSRVPNTSMFWVLQTEPNLGGAEPSGSAVFGIDKVSIHAGP